MERKEHVYNCTGVKTPFNVKGIQKSERFVIEFLLVFLQVSYNRAHSSDPGAERWWGVITRYYPFWEPQKRGM